MNVICGCIEACTATIELIGMGVGNLSVLWSHCSGLYHMVAGPLLGGGCGTALSFCQDFIGAIPGAIGTVIQSFMVK